MFGPVGSKKQMLENYRRSESTGSPIQEIVRQDSSKVSYDSDDQSSVSSRRRAKRNHVSSVRNHHELGRILREDTIAGSAVRKVANAAVRFVKERDYVLISAFETSALDYKNFRILLKRMFRLDFTDQEFVEVCAMFDSNDDKEVDGSEFIVVFTILSNLMKDEARRKQRERKERDAKAFRELAEAKMRKKNAAAEQVVDYDFTESEQRSALKKIHRAAAKYDRTHHSARSLKAFETSTLSPIDFRDSIKGAFDVSVTPQELGALVMHYNNGEPGSVPCNDFLVSFLRYGYEYRMQHRSAQIVETRTAEEKLQREHQKKVLYQLESLEEVGVNFDFSPEERASMLEKIKEAAGKYDKNHPAAVSLSGFDAKYLSPGAFRLTLKRTFHIDLTDGELGALVKMFDRANNNTVCNHDFLVHFTRVGYQVRSEKRSKQIKKERSNQQKEQEDHEKKILAEWKRDNLQFDPECYTPKDEKSAMMKLKREAERYHSEHVSAPDLSLFNGADMSIAEFREMVRRQMGVLFTYPELAALLPLIGSRSKPNMISTAEFMNKFKAMGWKERQRRRTKQLKLIAEREEQRKLEVEKRREKLTKMLNEAIDYDYSQSDMDSAVSKMTQAAYKYDKNHPGSNSLDAFMGSSMDPGVFSRMVKHTFNVNLTGKELGAIISIYDADGDGHIDSAEFLSNFFFMQRECRNAVRTARLEKIKQKEEEAELREREMERQQQLRISRKLEHNTADEERLMAKLIEVGKKFAIDNASYLEPIKVFKGPAMTAAAFQSTFFRIFLMKLSFPEIGALMQAVNSRMYELHVMDGNGFIKTLQKLGRCCEQVLLGKLDEKTITYDTLAIPDSKSMPSRSGSPISDGSRSPLPSIVRQRSRTAPRLGREELFKRSPSSEISLGDRSVTRGVGSDDTFIFSREGFYDSTDIFENDTASKNTTSDPYTPYLCRSISSFDWDGPDLFARSYSSQRSLSRSFSRNDSLPVENSMCRSSSSLSNYLRSDSTADSVVSDVTMFSPIKTAVPSSQRLNSSMTTVTENKPPSMLTSLLGDNPWSNADTQRGRGKAGKVTLENLSPKK